MKNEGRRTKGLVESLKMFVTCTAESHLRTAETTGLTTTSISDAVCNIPSS